MKIHTPPPEVVPHVMVVVVQNVGDQGGVKDGSPRPIADLLGALAVADPGPLGLQAWGSTRSATTNMCYILLIYIMTSFMKNYVFINVPPYPGCSAQSIYPI